MGSLTSHNRQFYIHAIDKLKAQDIMIDDADRSLLEHMHEQLHLQFDMPISKQLCLLALLNKYLPSLDATHL